MGEVKRTTAEIQRDIERIRENLTRDVVALDADVCAAARVGFPDLRVFDGDVVHLIRERRRPLYRVRSTS